MAKRASDDDFLVVRLTEGRLSFTPMLDNERNLPHKAQRELGPGEEPNDALLWLVKELSDIDQIITKELNKLPDNNPR